MTAKTIRYEKDRHPGWVTGDGTLEVQKQKYLRAKQERELAKAKAEGRMESIRDFLPQLRELRQQIEIFKRADQQVRNAYALIGQKRYKPIFLELMSRAKGWKLEEIAENFPRSTATAEDSAIKVLSAAVEIGAMRFNGWRWEPSEFGHYLSIAPDSPLVSTVR